MIVDDWKGADDILQVLNRGMIVNSWKGAYEIVLVLNRGMFKVAERRQGGDSRLEWRSHGRLRCVESVSTTLLC